MIHMTFYIILTGAKLVNKFHLQVYLEPKYNNNLNFSFMHTEISCKYTNPELENSSLSNFNSHTYLYHSKSFNLISYKCGFISHNDFQFVAFEFQINQCLTSS